MKIANKRWFAVLLKYIIIAALVIGAAIIIGLPVILKWVLQTYEKFGTYNDGYYTTCLCFLYPSGVLGFVALINAKGLIDSVINQDPFVEKNVKHIKALARISAILCIIYAVGIFFLNSFFTAILFVVFGLVSLLLSAFGELFAKAVEYKTDNDFTI